MRRKVLYGVLLSLAAFVCLAQKRSPPQANAGQSAESKAAVKDGKFYCQGQACTTHEQKKLSQAMTQEAEIVLSTLIAIGLVFLTLYALVYFCWERIKKLLRHIRRRGPNAKYTSSSSSVAFFNNRLPYVEIQLPKSEGSESEIETTDTEQAV